MTFLKPLLDKWYCSAAHKFIHSHILQILWFCIL